MISNLFDFAIKTRSSLFNIILSAWLCIVDQNWFFFTRENIMHLRLVIIFFMNDGDLWQDWCIYFAVRYYLGLQIIADQANERVESDELLSWGFAILHLRDSLMLCNLFCSVDLLLWLDQRKSDLRKMVRDEWLISLGWLRSFGRIRAVLIITELKKRQLVSTLCHKLIEFFQDFGRWICIHLLLPIFLTFFV